MNHCIECNYEAGARNRLKYGNTYIYLMEDLSSLSGCISNFWNCNLWKHTVCLL